MTRKSKQQRSARSLRGCCFFHSSLACHKPQRHYDQALAREGEDEEQGGGAFGPQLESTSFFARVPLLSKTLAAVQSRANLGCGVIVVVYGSIVMSSMPAQEANSTKITQNKQANTE
jgi:hypothetical protein